MAKDAGRQEHFSSRLGLLLSVLGIAVGTGNIWRFPRIVAQSSGDEGGGAFLIAWVVFLFIWSIPLIIAEYAIGQRTRRSVVGSFIQVAGERFAWMGAFVGFVSTAIMFYYAVVTGWCVYYFLQMVVSPLPASTEAATLTWEAFQGSYWPVVFLALCMGFGALVLFRGVAGIERVSKVLLPVLLAIVVIAALRAVTLPGSGEGIRFLFTPQWDLLARPSTWLEALTQNAWDTGAGWGLILTYAIYMQRGQGVVKNAFITGICNNTVSMLCGIMIFGIVFAILGDQMSRPEVLAVMKASGPASSGLTFIWMPQLFAQMPLGRVFAILFFLALSFAAFTSLVSMIELATRVLVDGGMERQRALVLVSVVGFILGLPSALSIDFLSNQDFVWGIGLMISGAFIALAVAKYGVTRFREETIDGIEGDWNGSRGWDFLIRTVVPIEALVLLIWWFYLSITAYAPDTWYDPFDPFSIATCIFQWGIVLLMLVMANKWMVGRTLVHR